MQSISKTSIKMENIKVSRYVLQDIVINNIVYSILYEYGKEEE